MEIGTLENVANLVWLLLAVTAVLFWNLRIRPLLRGHAARSLFFLVSALAILFPAISISDDLHPDLILATEGDGKAKRALKAADPVGPNASGVVGAAARAEAVQRTELAPGWAIFSRVLSSAEASPQSVELRLRPGRAPPDFRLS